MADELEQHLSDYDALVAEYARVAGPLDTLGRIVQDGIEMEDFRDSKPGKILVQRAVRRVRQALATLVDTRSPSDDVQAALHELRVQHAVLKSVADAVIEGRRAQQQILAEDHAERENPDEPAATDQL